MKGYLKLNIDEVVLVKLNERGIEIFEKTYRGFKVQKDSNGYSEIQLRDLMEIFGQNLSILPGNNPFDETILISEIYKK